jgi:signal peptidase II
MLAYLSLIVIAGTIVLLDQATKNWVRENLAFGESWIPWPGMAPYARILHWQNSGAAFGFFQNGGFIFAILAIFVAIMIVIYFPRIQRGDWPLRLAMGLQLGGALGNLVDRIQPAVQEMLSGTSMIEALKIHPLDGHVTDFISVGNFPVFNIADTSITLGVIALLLSVWLGGGDEEKVEQPGAQNPATSD